MISLIALVVSVISLVESYRNSALQNELARPIFESFEDAKMSERVSENGHVTYDLQIGVKNAGHLTAFVTEVVVRPAFAGFDDIDTTPCTRDLARMETIPSEDARALVAGRRPEEKEVPPDHQEWFYFNLEVPDSCKNFHSGFPINVSLAYRDRIHPAPYKQTVQMRAPMTHQH
jgi:hypothetical protein